MQPELNILSENELTSVPGSGVGRFGQLQLQIEPCAGQSVLVKSHFRVPLQVMQPIYDAAGCLCLYILSPTGGVVQRDMYQIEVVAGPGTHTLLTNPAATKVYRMPHGEATQQVKLEIKAGAVVEYWPEPMILFADSDWRQETQITLHDNALLLLQEIIMPGRLARGEVLRFRRYAAKLTVRDSSGLLLYDSLQVQPQTENMAQLGLLERYPCWGSWYLVGNLAGRQANPADFCQRYQAQLNNDESIGSLSLLHRNGVAGRMMSARLTPIVEAFEQLRQAVRAEVLGLPAAPLRRY